MTWIDTMCANREIDPEVIRLRELLERALFSWGLLDSENWDVNERADIRRSIIKE